ncbi:hypothetical protein EYR38_010146 [Pleurotus pulmonarius]|nr:hypothetical protein EYR38_010146 [Pleurotus pulmonarius]
MFSRAIFCTFLILPLLAVATVIPRTDPPASSCSTGTIQCCNSVQSAGNPVVGLLAGLLGIVLGPLDVLVGGYVILLIIQGIAEFSHVHLDSDVCFRPGHAVGLFKKLSSQLGDMKEVYKSKDGFHCTTSGYSFLRPHTVLEMLSHSMKVVFFVFALCALLAAATPVVEVCGYPDIIQSNLADSFFNKARGGDVCANGKKTMCCGELKTFDKNILGLLDGLLTTVVGLVGEVLKPTGLVGLECVPITLLGNGGLSDVCKANGVCCKDLTLKDAINVGCVPINIL